MAPCSMAPTMSRARAPMPNSPNQRPRTPPWAHWRSCAGRFRDETGDGALLTLVVFAVVGVVTLAGAGFMWATAAESIGDPPAPVVGGTVSQGDAVRDYFESNPRACPQVQIEESLLQRFPELPSVLAAVKFTLSQREWLPEPARRSGTRDYVRPSLQSRLDLLQLLNDPDLTLVDELPGSNRLVAMVTETDQRIRFGPAAAIDTSLEEGRETPFGLAFNLVHELVHLQQLREVGATDPHGDPGLEREANGVALHMPRSLYAGAAFDAILEANPCGDGPRETDSLAGVSGSLVLILDASSSMDDLDGSGQRRIDSAKQSLREVLSGGRIPASLEVALLVFFDCADMDWHPFTTNHGSLVGPVEAAEPTGSTPLAASISRAFDEILQRTLPSSAPVDIVVASDGEETCGGDPVAAAAGVRSAIRSGGNGGGSGGGVDGSGSELAPMVDPAAQTDRPEIRVSTIGFDVSGFVESQLQDIADAGGGQYLAARDADELTSALGESIDAGEPEPIPQVLEPIAVEPAETERDVPAAALPLGIAGGAMVLVSGILLLRRRSRQAALAPAGGVPAAPAPGVPAPPPAGPPPAGPPPEPQTPSGPPPGSWWRSDQPPPASPPGPAPEAPAPETPPPPSEAGSEEWWQDDD